MKFGHHPGRDGQTTSASFEISTRHFDDDIEIGLPRCLVINAVGRNLDDAPIETSGETAAGALVITTGNDTIGTLFVNYQNVTNGGTVTTALGVLTITGSPAAGYTYSYRAQRCPDAIA